MLCTIQLLMVLVSNISTLGLLLVQRLLTALRPYNITNYFLSQVSLVCKWLKQSYLIKVVLYCYSVGSTHPLLLYKAVSRAGIEPVSHIK